MDNYSGYPSDQCLIELLDYWLRHHHGQLKWKEVGSALEKIKLYQLAEKVLQITTTGKLRLHLINTIIILIDNFFIIVGKLSKIIDPEIDNDFNLHQSSNLAIDSKSFKFDPLLILYCYIACMDN